MSGQSALVIGAGIAGASVAYFLSRLGCTVTVIDAGMHTASHVPSALINPVRGQSGQVDAKALAGMRLTWTLIAELTAQGYDIPHAQSGVIRPVPDAKTRAKFERNLPADLPHEWLAPEACAELAGNWHSALLIPEGGWVDGAAFCAALLAAAKAERIGGRWMIDDGNNAFPIIHHPSSIAIFCGGSIGATWANQQGAGENATHRMGSMLLLDRAVSDVPLSFGAYLSPDARGGVLGGTFEAPAQAWQEPKLPMASLGWLLQKGEALADLSGARVTGRWTGSRLSGLRCGQDESGLWRLTGLSSKGFLLGPMLAQRLASEIVG